MAVEFQRFESIDPLAVVIDDKYFH
jgi:hypothetical protein